MARYADGVRTGADGVADAADIRKAVGECIGYGEPNNRMLRCTYEILTERIGPDAGGRNPTESNTIGRKVEKAIAVATRNRGKVQGNTWAISARAPNVRRPKLHSNRDIATAKPSLTGRRRRRRR